MSAELEQRLQMAIRSVKQLKTGDEVVAARYHGYQAERWKPTRIVSWQQPDASVADLAKAKLPSQILESPAVQIKLVQIDDRSRKAAVLRTLAQIANQTNFSNPYPTPLSAEDDGVGIIETAEHIIPHSDAPALWDRRIWFAAEQIASEGIGEEDWNPVFWDQETPMMDPREAEEDIRLMYGDEGLKLAKDVMLHVALQKESQKHLNEMHTPMRVPVVMMEIWSVAIHSKSFAEFIESLQSTMREQYKSESYILGRQYDTPLDGIVHAANGMLSFMAKAGLIGSNSKLFDDLQKIKAAIQTGWSAA